MHNEPLHRYVKLRVAHALGIPGTFSPPLRVSEAVDKEYFLTCVSIQTGLMVGLCALEANDEQQSKLFQYIEAEKNGRQFAVTSKFIYVHENYLWKLFYCHKNANGCRSQGAHQPIMLSFTWAYVCHSDRFDGGTLRSRSIWWTAIQIISVHWSREKWPPICSHFKIHSRSWKLFMKIILLSLKCHWMSFTRGSSTNHVIVYLGICVSLGKLTSFIFTGIRTLKTTHHGLNYLSSKTENNPSGKKIFPMQI